MRRISLPLILALAAIASPLHAADKPANKPATIIQLPPKPLLPMSFAGWMAVSAPVESAKPDATLQTQQDLLKELGFRRETTATYQKNSDKLNVQAIQFEDTTGAYGFFADGLGSKSTEPQIRFPQTCAGLCPTEFRMGDTVVQLTDAKKEDVEALAKTLPIPFGSKGEIPELPQYLPKSELNADSVQYALGPVGFAVTLSPLAGKIDFNTGAEVVVAKYSTGATLTIVEYPTPQMASAQLAIIAKSLSLAEQPDGMLTGDNLAAGRSGVLVALVSGVPAAQGEKLTQQVHYDAQVTVEDAHGYVSDAYRAARLYLNIAALAGILIAAAILLGLFFGGGRALVRVLRGKPASSVYDAEFISLDLGTAGDLRRLGAKREPPPGDSAKK